MLRALAPLALFLVGGCFLTDLELEDEGPDSELPPKPPPSLCQNGQINLGEQCDDGNATNGDGCSASCRREFAVTVRWRITTLAGEPVACPPGHDAEARISGRAPLVAPCEEGSLSFLDDQGGSLDVQIVDRVTHVVWGATEPGGSVSVNGASVSVSLQIFSDAGRLGFSWGFRNAADLVIDCALAGVTKVRTVLVPQSGGASTVIANDCSQYTGRTALLVAGTYDVSFEAGAYAPVVHSGVVIPPRGSAVAPPAVFRP